MVKNKLKLKLKLKLKHIDQKCDMFIQNREQDTLTFVIQAKEIL